MIFIELGLAGAYIIQPEPHGDKRGKFARLVCMDELKKIGHSKEITQVNYSLTRKKGTVRGMHFQYAPAKEIKMVKCSRGAVFDVIVDLRKDSPTLLQWHGTVLSAQNMKMMYVPEGFAHGFQTLEDDCELLYFHTEYYSPEHEGAFRYDDPLMGIDWPEEITEISQRDNLHPLLQEGFRGIL
ncbi:dTDP-4-dehydrorhamnose 3,5-epimerase [Desulfoluna spongiiphila]|uniref:dTDP-4-dehydrorhamnose 3,5-epimerase n=1 Tax=Desulfoluna spongiiphila TaxID=419481 RepID=A0A1G5JG41_9BACT|nr:dTDP-4-dehydrorhamnose 3,5-epimerase [Desulfoluna spongiiphila]SCY87124.1 dTDP-4-dehydrorhamnose 3,5-epimerase [Desulfoluna spongiiphila]